MSEETSVIDAIVERARAAQRTYEEMGSQALFDSACQAVAWVLMEPERNRQLAEALRRATVFPHEVSAAGKYLRRVGRPEAEKLLSRLIRADTDLKGGTKIPERIQLEYLLLMLSGRVAAAS